MEGKELAVAPYVGAWIETVIKKNHNDRQIVAPYVGAWIETDLLEALACYPLSHPTWVRGLKLYSHVAVSVKRQVAPYVGAWIETVILLMVNSTEFGRTLRGCVD